MQGETLPAASMVFVETSEEAFEIKAGRNGLEVLVMQFPGTTIRALRLLAAA